LIRFVTYLAPSLPEELFARIATHVGRRLGCAVALECDTRASGPVDDDPFARGDADVAFLCAPPFLALSDRKPPSVALLGAGLSFDDPRCQGAPVYFSDVIVRADSRAARFADLTGGVWAYNDLCSLSGFLCLQRKLRGRFFSSLRASGSHLASIAAVAQGGADAAAIDSNALRLAIARDPQIAARIRVLESWGPHPIQPIVARASLPAELRQSITEALLALGPLDGLGLSGCVPVDESHYAAERAALALALSPAESLALFA
jgi:phosphonate transport system substrate-binding protein